MEFEDERATSARGVVQIIASGSSGNAAFVRYGQTRILLDAGISYRRIKLALESLGEDIHDLDGVVLTHEHGDHIKGMDVFLKRHPNVPIYASRGTCVKIEREHDWRSIQRGQSFDIGQIGLHAYETSHDANEPLGFRLECGDEAHIGWATDLGYWTDEVAEHLYDCHLLVIEANHDRDLLRLGPYPWFLKQRVGSSRGHLSNKQARALLSCVASDKLQTVVLSHMSEKNNDSEVALETVGEALRGAPDISMFVAERKELSPLLRLDDLAEAPPQPQRTQGQLWI